MRRSVRRALVAIVAGGGVANLGASTLKSVQVTGNVATNGGGVANEGTLTLVDSQVSTNSSAFRGGGIHNMILTTGTVVLKSSVVASNTPDDCVATAC